jgi:hypothetical protein
MIFKLFDMPLRIASHLRSLICNGNGSDAHEGIVSKTKVILVINIYIDGYKNKTHEQYQNEYYLQNKMREQQYCTEYYKNNNE